jgi:uncharacterized protein YjbI with pentapeptide repeats
MPPHAKNQGLRHLALAAALALPTLTASAQVFRWDNGALIPGTSGIVPGSGANFANLNLDYANLQTKQLQSANFSNASLIASRFGGSTLTSANFASANLATASLSQSNLASANLTNAVLTNAFLSSANLTSANLTNALLTNANLSNAFLTDANLTGATIAGADLILATSRGFTSAQLYSTASYEAKNLTRIRLSINDLTAWNFASQDLSSTNLSSSTLTSASFQGANVTRAAFDNTTSRGFTAAQLYSTASYQIRDLTGIRLQFSNNLTAWDFSSQNLTSASFAGATLTSTNFVGAIITKARFDNTTRSGFTAAQFYSTASYQSRDLTGVGFDANILDGWNFASQNLTAASFGGSTTASANFTLADLRSATNFFFSQTNPTYSITRGAILPDGSINPFALATGETLRIRANTLAATALGTITGPATSAITLDPAARLILSPNGSTNLASGSLTLGAGSTLASNNNDLILNYSATSPIAQLITYLQSGQLLPSPTSNGLPTTLAISEAADLGLTTFNGITIDDTTVILKFTFVGDANLDGQVDALDYERIDLAIGNSGVLGTAQGDLNYDQQVDALDYEQVDLNIGNGVGSPLAQVFIPEPTALAPLALLPLLTARKRR